jgi:hypothetical protein
MRISGNLMRGILTLDEATKRDVLRRGRKVLGLLPGAMYFYGLYWKFRFYIESKLKLDKSDIK